ncbi:MAG: Ig-like domain-containing protein [Marinilabiliales bacterium]|nr:Ig-like domain-containing protein [Marinilabiliales bacterium]
MVPLHRSNVPVNPTIRATFNVNVDPATATAANITMVQDYDAANVALTITTSGNDITIVPQANLGTGALYQLNFGAGLMSTDGLAITATAENLHNRRCFCSCRC